MGNCASTVILCVEAQKGDLELVKKALESGAKINSGLRKKETPLTIAAFYGHLNVVQFLVESGANPYLPYAGNPPRDWALYAKHQNVANYLETVMKQPMWVNKIDDKTGYTPLTHAIFKRNVQKAQTIIDFGADVCRIDRHGKTPLIYAIEQDSMEMVIALLRKGAIMSGVSAVKIGLELRRNDILKVLITNSGFVINSCFEDGFTPLTKALTTFNTEIAKYLIEKGADVAKSDNKHNTPLWKALEVNSLEIAELLRSKGVQVPKTLDENLFRKLADDGNVEVYKFLIKNGWDVNQLDENRKTALSLSAAKQYLRLSRFLIQNGANVSLAKTEVETFCRTNVDFYCFMKQIIPEKQEIWAWSQTGQE